MDGFTDSEKFAKDLSFMTEADWEKLRISQEAEAVRREAEKRRLNEEKDREGRRGKAGRTGA